MNEMISKKISNVNFILTLIIILLHSECFSYLKASDHYTLVRVGFSIIQAICSIAVPTFFAIAAYLFFYNYNNYKYFLKLKTRVKTLVIPYLCWSTIFLLFFIVISNIPQFRMFDGVFVPVQYNPIFMIKSILFATYDGVLWFVRDLLIFIIASPVIYIFCKKIGILNYLLILVFIIINLIFNLNDYALYWLPVYYIFSFIAINYSAKIETLDFDNVKFKFIKWLVILTFLILLILVVIFSNDYYVYFFYRVLAPIFIFFISCGSSIFKTKIQFCKYSFIIYCSHRWLTIIVKKTLILIFGINEFTSIIFQFLTFGITIIILYLIIRILEKILPSLLNVLSGNRMHNS